MKFEELTVGQRFRTASRTVDEEEIRRFAAQYDPQYMHLDAHRAAESIFGGIIASGLHTLAVTWRLWVDLDVFGGDIIGGVGMDRIRFLRPVYPGDTLTAEAEIAELRSHPKKKDRGYVAIRINTINQKGENVLTAEVTGLVARR